MREKEEREKKSARSEQERTEIEKEAKRKAWLDAKVIEFRSRATHCIYVSMAV